MKIFLDLDEVLVDFVGGALKAHGWTLEQLYANWEPGSWDMTIPMGLSQEEFWKPINEIGAEFWSGLESKPWMERVIELVTSHEKDGWSIVTAPSACDSSRRGKIDWIRENFGRYFDRYEILSDKERLARPGTILIDDREETIQKFRAAGGQAILFPCYHNSHHRLRYDPVSHVENVLKELCQ